MKKALTIAAILIATSAVFSSCKKMYNCECIDNTGHASTHTVNATNRVEAATNCSNISKVKDCQLK